MRDLDRLKRQVLNLAGYIAADEEVTASDMSLSMRELVARVLADKGITPGQSLLILLELAVYADAHSGRMID